MHGRRRPRLIAAGSVALATMTAAAAAHAECDDGSAASTCLTSDTLWPHPGPARWAAIAGTELVARDGFAVGLVTTYLKRPVVLRVPTPGGGGTRVAAIDDQVTTTVATAYGVRDWLSAEIALPLTIHQDGVGNAPLTGRSPPASQSLRDPRLGLAFAIVRRPLAAETHERGRHVIAITGRLETQLPTGATSDFAGEKGVVIAPTVTGDVRFGRLLAAAEIGARLRPVEGAFVGQRQGTQAGLALGVSFGLLERELLAVGLEGRALYNFSESSTTIQTPLGLGTASDGRHTLPSEWLASVRSAPWLAGDLTFLLAGGGPIPFGGNPLPFGVPEIRFVAGLAYAPLRRDSPQ